MTAFQSTTPVWGSTFGCVVFQACVLISIHDPRVGIDQYLPCHGGGAPLFQSTTPVWGSTGGAFRDMANNLEFQSTTPVWGSTPYTTPLHVSPIISIHDPRVGIDAQAEDGPDGDEISIHDPRVGIDERDGYTFKGWADFNPRPPCGDRLQEGIDRRVSDGISIHDPRVGIDSKAVGCWRYPMNFNPRPPCGDRQHRMPVSSNRYRFQSTTPVWGSTVFGHLDYLSRRNFNPRPPCGDRLQKFIKLTAQPIAKAAIPPIAFCYRQRGMPFRS